MKTLMNCYNLGDATAILGDGSLFCPCYLSIYLFITETTAFMTATIFSPMRRQTATADNMIHCLPVNYGWISDLFHSQVLLWKLSFIAK